MVKEASEILDSLCGLLEAQEYHLLVHSVMITLVTHLLKPRQHLLDLILLTLHLQLDLVLQVIELFVRFKAYLIHISQVVDLFETPAEKVRIKKLFVRWRVLERGRDRLGVLQEHILSFPQYFLVDRFKDG